MKRVIILLICLGSISYNIYGQGGRLRGSKLSQIGIGFSGVGPLISAYGGISFDPRIKGLIGGGYGYGKDADLNYKYVFIDGVGSFNMKSVNRFFYFNVLAGASFVGDFINKFPTDVYTKQFSINYGVLGGCEGEFYIQRNVAFILNGTQRYYIKKEFGQWRYQVSVAIRFIF